jgi:signal transduction histidine kinase
VAEIVVDLDKSLPLVDCLQGEFSQVILNLIINASHAIADTPTCRAGEKGRITISTRRLGEENVEIRVEDTGTGIPESARDRIFDPFFTTKAVGKGTGQGLANAWSTVVDKHGGKLLFETELGRGTAFLIQLPIKSAVKIAPS